MLNAEAESVNMEGGSQSIHSRSLRNLLARGGSTLGVAVAIERGCGFLANLFAARAAGPQTFGAYSVVLATAGTIANYAGAGIGSTANRFSGEYPIASQGYRGFLRTIMLVSLGSALLGAGLMLAGAGPFARVLLRNDALVNVLRIAALSAGALILLECCRGLLIGQHKFQALILLSLVSGVGMLLILPAAAHVGAGAMIGGHASVALVAVAVCAMFSRRLGIVPAIHKAEEGRGPGVSSILKFGLVQFGAVVGINIASWWLASLVARSDTSLVQMGMYAVANQFRGLASIMPGLLSQISYPLLTAESWRDYGGPERVLLVNTFLATALVMVFACGATIVLPWILLLLYGASYTSAETPAVIALGTATIHMSSVPAAYRLSIVNLRATGAINMAWAVVVVSFGILFVPAAGATGAAAAFLIAHLFTQCAVLIALRQSHSLPKGILQLSVVSIFGTLLFVLGAYFRAVGPTHRSVITGALMGLLLLLIFVLLRFGQKQEWLPKICRRALRGGS
ncbi:MAG: oligosaccharide flippase family protein [Acidobacteriota bacterium]